MVVIILAVGDAERILKVKLYGHGRFLDISHVPCELNFDVWLIVVVLHYLDDAKCQNFVTHAVFVLTLKHVLEHLSVEFKTCLNLDLSELVHLADFDNVISLFIIINLLKFSNLLIEKLLYWTCFCFW